MSEKAAVSTVQVLQQAIGESAYEQFFNAYLKYLKTVFDIASGYTRIVLGLGYAAFFAIWSATRGHMGKRQVIWSALLILCSLVFYVLFEVSQMLFNAWVFKGTRKRLELALEKLQSELKAHELAVAKASVKLYGFWCAAVVLTLVPAIGAIGILLYSFVSTLLRG
jgi:hypothetical protein